VALSRSRGIVGVVSDRRRLLPDGSPAAQTRSLVDHAAAAARAGADFFQIREHDLAARELVDLLGRILSVIAGFELKVLVNDRLDVAIAARAHGVHLPSAGLSPSEVRAIVPGGFLIGQSIHGADAADTAADFAIFGTVFRSVSKAAGHRVAGVEALARAAHRGDVPVLAIGGVNEANVDVVARVCAGVAAIGWFNSTNALTLTEAVRRARAAFEAGAPVRPPGES
jgi:thiamine-phosphate pyrophosphorylase